ncbi:MAG TPA: carboxypeptidase regulatory-like domain-containing protein, partial [Longimicrobium sp.]|nr:carboxypeptidase regulatory-like domain-containing protein [Longimicrobium sp.]
MRWVAWAAALLIAAPCGAQVTGRVVDAESGDPVAEAVVAADGGRALTDSAGAFTLAAAPGRGSARVSRIGYENREISWDPTARALDLGVVKLEPAELTLEALRVELDRVDRLADETAYAVARMDERALAHSASDNALDAVSQRFGITSGNCPALRARMGTCRQVRGTATSVCLIVDESFIPGGVAGL